MTTKKINNILIANRGEIAVRVIRTAQSLGYRAIAVYSEADAEAPHVQLADDAVLIGAAPVGESYLRPEKILQAAAESGADAIHPGYGFLSENADFARAVEEAGLTFIGPNPEAIDIMGDKAKAKRHMIAANVPCVPGFEGQEQGDETLIAAAADIGFPLMVKAAGGGGGRGMRLVRNAGDLLTAIQSARSEALNAFGSDVLILEKAIIRPRHVEVQVFADEQGNTIHFGERDCSVQRRHQKVVEEAPCPIMTEELRTRMGEAAVAAARSVNYRGAGTVEFLLDEQGEFYFLEMNTRLQVEHPVTEMITGVDLVALQIQVAEGRPLGIEQQEVQLTGHSIEVRLYAEDPANDFLPVSGKVALWEPASGDGIRIDAGIASGSEISSFYDPMIAKVITWGESREIAVSRLVKTLKQSALLGLETNRNFLVDILGREQFLRGEATTAFIEEEFGSEPVKGSQITPEVAAIAALLQFLGGRDAAVAKALAVSEALYDWGSWGVKKTAFRYLDAETVFDVGVQAEGSDRYTISCNDNSFVISVRERLENVASLVVNGKRSTVYFQLDEQGVVHLATEDATLTLVNDFASAEDAGAEGGSGRVDAPMHGVLLEVFVGEGDAVKKGDRLAVLEAMKMQHELLSDVDGKVLEIGASAGSQVAASDLIVQIEV